MRNLHTGSDVAIIGMAGLFPDAADLQSFWRNLRSGRSAVRRLSDDELRAAGVTESLLTDPAYVKAGIVLEGADAFDASFFGYTPRDAELMDPQHRIFLELAWAALEDSGCSPEHFPGAIGVFGSCGFATYFLQNVLTNRVLLQKVGLLQAAIGNETDSLPSTVSYKLNLSGPSVAVQTFCSSSLVAVHLACQSVLNYECDVALAGASALNLPQGVGYLYQSGGILSPDGCCRTFDARAQGSIYGSGAGVLVLKRLDDALDHGDHIRAVIKGSAVNNDGSLKVGYTAPGVNGQSSVISEAIAAAGVAPDTIGYIEAHGSATPLGDSIEIAALLKAFRGSGAPAHSIALGSIKTNIGHLDRAAGVAGVIKVALALQHRQLPPSLNFEAPNADVDFDNSPFYVNTELADWAGGANPRRAGVSSFGLGGTNAHVVIEEAPEPEPSEPSRGTELLIWSTKTRSALDQATANLLAYLRGDGAANMADVAFTLQSGRAAFNHRRMLVCQGREDAVAALEALDPKRVFTREQDTRNRPISFLFPGVGDQYPGMARGLYETEPVFRDYLDRCCTLLQPHLDGCDVRSLLFADAPASTDAADSPVDLRRMLGRGTEPRTGELHRTRFAQPAVFSVEYALARLLMDWGLRPHSLLGYSLGEYVAACLAGVFSLEDALWLVARRAKLIEQTQPGAMLTVPLSARRLEPLLGSTLSMAVINGPALCVVAGEIEAIERLEQRLAGDEVLCRRLPTTHAFHSHLVEPVLAEYAAAAGQVTLHAAQIPLVSNVTGTWITPEQATNPAYWVQQMRQTVLFGDGAKTLLRAHDGVLVEVGPGQSIGSFVKQLPDCEQGRPVVAALRHALHRVEDTAFLLSAVGQLWLAGVQPDWHTFSGGQRRRHVPLPTYPFERQRYWLDPGTQFYFGPDAADAGGKKPDVSDWFYEPVWSESPRPTAADAKQACVLIFLDDLGIGTAVGEYLARRADVITVRRGAVFARDSERAYTIDPDADVDYQTLLGAVRDSGSTPSAILHLWTAARDAIPASEVQERGFYSLLRIARSLGAARITTPIQMLVVSNGLHAMDGEELFPDKATMLGPCRVIPQEYPQITCRSVDIRPDGELHRDEAAIEALAEETLSSSSDFDVCLRGSKRFSRAYRPLRLEPAAAGDSAIRRRGVYLITGGMGGVGLVLAEHLAERYQARLVLIGRTPLPDRSEWDDHVADHGPDDRISRVLSALRRIEQHGSEVLVVAADVADPSAMAGAIAEAERRFGPLNGVIHAAGVTTDESYRPVAELNADSSAPHFRAKIGGVSVLGALLRDREPDFCLVFSSLAAVLGGITLGAYSAANAFLDSFVNARPRPSGTRWIVVNWDTWKVHGHESQSSKYHKAATTVAQFTMTPAEGVEACLRVLSAPAHRHLVQSTADMGKRLDQWVRRVALRLRASDQPSPAGRLYSRPQLATAYEAARSSAEQRISRVWQNLLGIESIGVHDNYFDLGGNSLLALQLTADLQQEFSVQLSPVAIFEAPTICDLARLLDPGRDSTPRADDRLRRRIDERLQRRGDGDRRIAVIGMAGRFPGARDVEELWTCLRNGTESISEFTDDELTAAGVDPAVFSDPRYVRRRPVLEEADLFDAPFFGYTPREASVMDPQHRLFLETAWETLERAGYDSWRYDGAIGVFGGSNFSSYLLNLLGDPDGERVDLIDAGLGNDRDSLTTKVSYKLNLKGPSLAVQTFCSTSLVAVHLAAQSLRHHECDMALAGGVNLRIPQKVGHLFEEGGQESPDGHTRTFDARARGTVFGDAVAAVLLKRLEDAIADGDHVHAIIRGSAINNDGSVKVSYTAPSVDGQAEVIAMALADAGVDASTIDYVEAHGTATELGDPIEVAALTKAFRLGTDAKHYCALGSLKTNVGHLDRTAGVAGLIKTVMALEHEAIPASLHFESPNPKIDFESSPFVVNAELRPWRRNGRPRRAGVSSLGVGGTNAHVILEEAPEPSPPSPSRPEQLLLLSARSREALDRATANLADFLKRHPEAPLPDVAYTLQVGRRVFKHRRMLVCDSRADAIAALERADAERTIGLEDDSRARPVSFLLPAGGDLEAARTRGLYDREPAFHDPFDRCCTLLQPLLDGLDLRTLLFKAVSSAPEAAAARVPPHAVQPAVFALDYALAQLLSTWGVHPHSLLGYGGGEWAAACLAGVVSLEDAVALVVDPAAAPRRAALNAPHIPVVSSVTGEWLTPEEATDPDYWSRPRPDAVPSHAGIATLLAAHDGVLLDVGGGASLAAVAQGHPDCTGPRTASIVPAVASGDPGQPDVADVLTTIGKLWLAGVDIDWAAFHAGARRQRIPLPTYPFERRRYWIEPRSAPSAGGRLRLDRLDKTPDVSRWFYSPVWTQSTVGATAAPVARARWLALVNGSSFAEEAMRLLERDGHEVIRVSRGETYRAEDERHYTIDPRCPADYRKLLEHLTLRNSFPTRVAHFWTLDSPDEGRPLAERIPGALDAGLYSMLYLIQALGDRSSEPLDIALVTSGLNSVLEDDLVLPEKATLAGPCRVIPQEFTPISCKIIDLSAPAASRKRALIGTLAQELVAEWRDPVVAYRGGRRWVQSFERLTLEHRPQQTIPFPEGGVCLVTGGLGGIGLAIAEHLSRTLGARLVLVGRSGLPPREDWDRYLRDVQADDPVAEKIWQVREMENSGSEVLILRADVADAAQMRSVIEQTHRRFGALHGVIHAAGVPAAGLMQLKTREAIEAVLASKLHATAMFDELLADTDVKILVLISSMTSITGGGPGQLDYCAGNAFLDAYAQAHAPGDRTVVSIDWGEWQWNAWQEGLAGFDPSIQQLFREHRRKVGISFPEGMDALDRILGAGLRHVVVSTQDFDAVIEASRTFTVDKLLRESEARHDTQCSHARPLLGTEFVAPRNDVEETLAAIWQQLLGIDRLGVDDNFFELGGHSLLAMQIFSRVRRTYDINLSLREMFDAPTIATQAEMLSAVLWATRAADLAARPSEGDLIVEGEI